MKTQTEALKALIHEMEYVLSCINEDKIPFDGDDFHEALRLGKEALAKQEQGEPERCHGCEACINTACGRDECPKGWPKAPQQRTWVGLTDAEIAGFAKTMERGNFLVAIYDIEKKLKEKNG